MVLKCLIKDALCDFILMRYCYTIRKWELKACPPTPSPTSLAFLQAATWHYMSVKWSSEQSCLGRGSLAGQTRVLPGY